MTRKPSLGKRLRGLLMTVLLLGVTVFLLYRLFRYQQARATFPFDRTIASLNVGGMTPEEAAELLRDHYLEPVAIFHGDSRIELDPADVGFNLEVIRWWARRRCLQSAQLLAGICHRPDED